MKKKSETILGLMGIVVIITLFSGAGSAAPGDLLTFVTVPVPSSSGIGIGIDYDGTSILYTNYQDPTVYKTDFSGANLGSVPLINPDGSRFTGGLNAIAYNFNDNMLYGGGWSSTNLYKTDLSTGVTTLVMANAIPPAFGFIDGLAWDPTDNTFWMSDDVQCNVRHLDVLGNDIGGFDGCAVTGLPNSGLAVSLNGFLWYGTNGAGLIHRLDTTTNPPTDLGVFSSPGGRDEDMVCGPKYTKPGVGMVETLLSKDAYNNQFAIIEVADGTCITPAQPKGSISGMKFDDLDNDGVNDAGEPGLSGWTITLTNSSGNMISATTGATGSYAFTGLTPDTYTVAEVQQAGWTQTAPAAPGTYTVTITGAAEQVTGKDFGNHKEGGVKLEASCVETVNPSGNHIPTAGANPKSGQNPDGFYMIGASDPAADVFVKDTGSGMVFGPFASGTNIKYTEANGAKPSQKKIGGPDSAVDWHIKGTGDAAVYATLGNAVSPEVSCLVPPPPK